MAKLLLLIAIAAVAVAAPVEKRRVSPRDFIGRRDPFPEPKFAPPTPANISLLTITQRVDNFDPTNPATWEQRYYVNNEFYTPGSPIFLFLSGEWAITPFRMTQSHMWTMASEFNANIFYLEHRFYGESRPTPDASDENLRFLNPEQALADTAHFINHIQSTVEGAADSEFILVGGHYSASLAVWFRQRYPHLATGVWASSAPLPSVVDMDQFMVAAGQAFRVTGGDSCYHALDVGFDAMDAAVDAGEWDELTEVFRLCDPLEPEDVPFFFSFIAELYSSMPLFSTEWSMEVTCAYIELESYTIESIAHILEAILDEGECIWLDRDYIIESDRQTAWNATSVVSGFRQWTYQVCSQIGWFHSSSAANQPFSDNFPVEFFFEACEGVFGDNFTPERLQVNSDRFNTIYGGLEPDVTNVVFVYGQHDPWSVIGRRTDLNEDATAIIIEGATMGNDLGLITDEDSDALVEAKNQITEIIRGWINADD